MEQPQISVIVPIYKVEKYLPKCVNSILHQTYPNLEIILVDDGSPDGCGQLCDDYARQDSRVRVIHKTNGGLSDARNAGIDMAQGDYLAFADSDDWLEPDAYEIMLAAAQRHRAALVCAGRYDEDEETGVCTIGLCPEKEELLSGEELVRRIFHWNHLDSAAWDKLYARELFREIRYPVGEVVEDVPTTYRLALLAGGGVLLPKPVYHYRHRAGSITMANVSQKSFHFIWHADAVYRDVCETKPELEPDAHYLLVYALRYTVQMLDIAGKKAKREFSREYHSYAAALRKQLSFALKCEEFSGKEKLELCCTAFGLFPQAVKANEWLKKLGIKKSV